MHTTKTGPTCTRCGSLVIPGGCVNRCKEGTMKTAREVACYFSDCTPGSHRAYCDDLTAVIEADRRELVEAAATVIKDARGECNDNELMRRIRALIPKEAP